MKRWQWLAIGGVGLGLAAAATAKRREIVSYLTFDPNRAVPDPGMAPYKQIGVAGIFEKYKSYVRTLTASPSDVIPPMRGPLPGTVSLATWIELACNQAGVNPAWILVSLQREQSLLELTDSGAAKLKDTPKTWTEFPVGSDGKPTKTTVRGSALDYKLRWALGYAAFEDGFQPNAFGRPMAGIVNQIREVAFWTGRNMVNQKSQVGVPLTLDGQKVVPANVATVLSYRFTPHVDAARLNYNLYRKYFPELMA